MTGSPSDRITRGKTGASQVTGPSYSYVPRCTRRLRLLPHFGLDPSSPLLLFEKIHGETAVAFTQNRTLGSRNGTSFRGQVPTAHTLVCLRFAGSVTEAVARLTTGLDGLTPGRAGLFG